MSQIKVNTGMVDSTADAIAKYNRELDNDFSKITSSVSDLNSRWEGSAADAAMGSFNKLKKNCADPRYQVTDQLVAFLKKTVGVSYETAENTIIDNAKAFK